MVREPYVEPCVNEDRDEFQTEIDRLLTSYIQEVDESDLTPLSAQVYRVQAINFVRWIKGDFKPGSRKRGDI